MKQDKFKISEKELVDMLMEEPPQESMRGRTVKGTMYTKYSNGKGKKVDGKGRETKLNLMRFISLEESNSLIGKIKQLEAKKEHESARKSFENELDKEDYHGSGVFAYTFTERIGERFVEHYRFSSYVEKPEFLGEEQEEKIVVSKKPIIKPVVKGYIRPSLPKSSIDVIPRKKK